MQLLFLLSTMRQLYIMLFLTSMNCSMHYKGRVVIVLDPPWEDLFETESIILKCMAEDGSSGWKYEWAKENKGMLEKLKNTPGSNGDTYRIISVKEYDSGIYWCQADRGTEKTESASCTLNVLKGHPGVSITLQPPFTKVYVGEWISLKCEVKEMSAGWKYFWSGGSDSNLIQAQYIPDATAIGTELRFKPVNLSHQMLYWCQALRNSFQSTSSSFLLKITDKVPMVLLSIQTLKGPIFSGETVSMKCELDGDSTGWIYIWYKGMEHNSKFHTNSSRDPAGSNYIITQSRISDSDVYRCQAERPATHFFSKFSETATLKIYNTPKPRLTIETKWMKVYPTEKVSLKCKIENFTSDWIYTWYKDGIEQNTCRNSQTCSVYTINSVAEQHSGNYTCRANAHSRYSEISDPLSLHVFSKYHLCFH
ncbi:Fc receptor-like protein 5 [Erpetoichthys calabaricus]|uniref:Fc receptor-like protein 5 n=1 Tax=Erpetoichthys calabaricus TaxID=27687 RepID=UPI002234A628|nr:Fc receptor-like protein 5 [Erpetoichthys calabaricus]